MPTVGVMIALSRGLFGCSWNSDFVCLKGGYAAFSLLSQSLEDLASWPKGLVDVTLCLVGHLTTLPPCHSFMSECA